MNTQIRSTLALLVLAVAVASACGPSATRAADAVSATPAGSDTATGVVVAVEGDLSTVTTFSVRLSDGVTLVLVPADGVLFDGNAPLSHLRDHLVSGDPVGIAFHADGDRLISTAVGDSE